MRDIRRDGRDLTPDTPVPSTNTTRRRRRCWWPTYNSAAAAQQTTQQTTSTTTATTAPVASLALLIDGVADVSVGVGIGIGGGGGGGGGSGGGGCVDGGCGDCAVGVASGGGGGGGGGGAAVASGQAAGVVWQGAPLPPRTKTSASKNRWPALTTSPFTTRAATTFLPAATPLLVPLLMVISTSRCHTSGVWSPLLRCKPRFAWSSTTAPLTYTSAATSAAIKMRTSTASSNTDDGMSNSNLSQNCCGKLLTICR
mmetsp:Transcript_5394/g.13106  ORF Transcript_5394/g.13106 Transcript_5394/m.13106 type:complete len:255 (-) Transcript_5394:1691-2455(-)